MNSSAPRAPGRRSRRHGPGLLRTGLGTVLGLAAASLVAVLVPLHWAQETVVSQDGFTRVVGTLADDRPFQEELARAAVMRTAENLVGERAASLPFLDRIVDNIAGRAADAAAELTSDPSYRRAWTQTLVRTHAANVPADRAVDRAPEDLVLDLGPLFQEVDSAVQGAVGVDLRLAERDSVLTVPGSGTGRVVDTVTGLTGLAVPLTWTAAALAALALVVSRRRLATLAVLGLGSLAGLGAVWLFVEALVHRVTGVLGADLVVRMAVDRVALLLTESLAAQMATAAWIVGITGAVGLVGAAAVSSGSRRRGRPTA